MVGDRSRGGPAAGRALAALAVGLGAALVWGLRTPPPPDARDNPAAHAEQARAAEVKRRFDQAVLMLHARQYEHAVTALHRVLELSPRLPEAHANMGFALAGLKRWAAARDFFQGAIELEPRQANAYYGLGLASDALGDRALAKGAMRSYLHLARGENEAHLARARAALWEWEREQGAPAR